MSPATTNSSRWSPTPDQLMILEEIYRSGCRTPNAAQIQQIASHLSLYGKIEGKNVFYWFQNHKARDRQKLRRRIYKQLQHHLALHYNAHELQQQEMVQRRRFVEQQFLHLQPGHPQKHQPFLQNEWTENCVTAENGVGKRTTCRSGPLKTLELFPVTAGKWGSKDVSCCSSSCNSL